MKNVPIVGILAAASLLTGCRSTPAPQTTTPQAASPQAAAAQSDASPSATPQSVIDLVRNGYLESNKTTTIGKALAGTFQNGAWKSFATDKGTTVIEFDGTELFGDALDSSSTFDKILDKIHEDCKAEAAKTASSEEHTAFETQTELETCIKTAFQQHNNDAIPISVQFTVNHDGGFQYLANNMGLTTEELIKKIYN